MAQGIASSFVVAAHKIDVENVLPGAAAHGTGFDFAQADVPEGKDAERFEEATRDISDLESNGSLIRTARNQFVEFALALEFRRYASSLLNALPDLYFARRQLAAEQLTNQEETREVALVIFKSSLKDFRRIFPGGVASGDCRRVGKLFRNDVLYAAGGVIKGKRLDVRVSAKEFPALIERDGMGKHSTHPAQPDSGRGDKIVDDAQPEFGLNEDVMCQEKIGVLGHGASQRVFDRNDGRLDRSLHDAVEDFRRTRAWHNPALRQHPFGRLVAEGAEFTLNGNLDAGISHNRQLSCLRSDSQSFSFERGRCRLSDLYARIVLAVIDRVILAGMHFSWPGLFFGGYGWRGIRLVGIR